jgi:hypothetical protein
LTTHSIFIFFSLSVPRISRPRDKIASRNGHSGLKIKNIVNTRLTFKGLTSILECDAGGERAVGQTSPCGKAELSIPDVLFIQ